MFVVTAPSNYDTVVTSNMFGDIFTDLGRRAGRQAQPRREPRTAPTGGWAFFENIHGSAPQFASP